MTSKTLALPMTSTKASLESDRPFTGKYHITYHVYDALAAPTVRTLPDGRLTADFSQVIGRLAERFEPSADFSSWRVHLRQGVTSHAGNELTADDVVWSYNRVFALRAIGMWRASTIAGVPPVDGVRAIDRSTVEFRIDGFNPVFPRYLCYGTSAIIDSTEAQKHTTANDPWAGEYLRSTPCGFGGWDLVKHDDQVLQFRPRAEFWAGAPPVEGVIYRSAPTREDGLAQFERGDVNLLVGLYPDEVRQLSNVPGTQFAYGRTNHATIEMDHNRPPFDDRRVREAVLRTVPYQRIVDEGYYGLAEIQHGIYQPNTPEFTDAEWTYEPDLEKSRALVKAAGAGGTTVQFGIVRSAEAERIANLVAEALAEIGLNVQVRFVADMAQGEVPEMYLRDDCSHGIADAHYDLGIDFAAPRDMPFRLFQGRRLTGRMREIRRSPADQQAGLYREVQREILGDALVVPVAGHSYVLAHNDQVDPWFFTPAYLPYSSFLWSDARYVLPPAR